MTQAPPRTPTAKELVAAKKAQAPAAPTPAPAAAPQVPAVRDREQEAREYRQRYLDEVAPATLCGRLVKFSKDGVFVTADDEQPVPETSEFILLAPDTQVGWIKFAGTGEPPERHMGLLYDDFRMPLRESLGDLDQAQWELGLDGQPADPWLHQQNVVLQDTKTREMFTFSTSSRTGRRAVGNVLRHFDRMQKTHPGELPVAKLSHGEFEHRDPRVGRVNVPLFIVIGRVARDTAATPDTSIGAFLNDAVPHLE